MSKILFVTDFLFENQGIEFLSAFLKQNGQRVGLIIETNKPTKNALSRIYRFRPDLLAFSVTSSNYQWAVQLSMAAKKEFNVLTIFGGAHPTFCPDFISNSGVDIICIGEGEYPLLELAQKLDLGEDITKIKNLWVKKNGKIYINELRPLIEDLDKLPFLDRDIYYEKSKLLRNLTNKRFLVSRGCPYSCTFCHNQELRNMYKGKGDFVRFRTPSNIIREIKEIKEKYGLKTISFCSETFTSYPGLIDFLDLYKDEIGLPFFCQGRFNELDEEKIKKLKGSGCMYIALGVETGSERIRNDIMKRDMTDGQIILACRLLKKYKLKFIAYAMFGLPTETIYDAEKTMAFLADIAADKVIPNVYQPINKTGLFNFIEKNNLFDENYNHGELPNHYAYDSPVKLERKKEILNLHKLSFVGVKYPRLTPLIKKIIKLPPNPIFKILNIYGIFDAYRVSRGMGWYEMARLSWENRNTV